MLALVIFVSESPKFGSLQQNNTKVKAKLNVQVTKLKVGFFCFPSAAPIPQDPNGEGRVLDPDGPEPKKQEDSSTSEPLN